MQNQLTKTTKGGSVVNSLPIVAAMMGRNFGVNVVMGNFPTASTDMSTIYIPHFDPEDEAQKVATFGYVVHECGHIRCGTDIHDFQSISSARLRYLANLLEDGRIERGIARIYPGAKGYLEKLTGFLIEQGKLPAAKAGDNPGKVLVLYMMHHIAYRLLGYKVAQDVYEATAAVVPEHFSSTFISRVDALLMASVVAPDWYRVHEIAKELIKLMEEEAEREQQQANSNANQDSQQGDTQGADQQDGAQGDTQGADQQDGAQGDTQGTDQQDSAQGDTQGADQQDSAQGDTQGADQQDGAQGDTQGADQQDGAQGDTQGADQQDSAQGDTQGADQQGGAQGDTQGADQQDGAQGDTQGADQQDGAQGDTQGADQQDGAQGDTQEAGQQGDGTGAMTDALESLESELEPLSDKGDVVAPFLRDNGQSSAQSGAVIQPTREFEPVTRSNGKGYYHREVQGFSNSLGNHLEGLFDVETMVQTGYARKGRRVETKRLCRIRQGDLRVFRTKNIQESEDTALYIALDMSASMDHVERDAIKTTLALALAISQIPGVELKVCAFRGDKPVYKLKDFGEALDNTVAGRFDSLTANNGTPMVPIVSNALLNLMGRPEPRKVLWMITDGHDYGESDELFNLLPSYGIEVAGLFFGEKDTSNPDLVEFIQGIMTRKFGRSWQWVESMQQLKQKLIKLAQETLATRK